MLVSDVNCTLFIAHLVSVVFSWLNVALCPAMEVVYEFCLHRISLAGGRRSWLSSPGLCISHGGVSRAPDPLGAEDRRALLCRVHIAWLDEFCGLVGFFEFYHGSVLRLCVFAFCHERVLSFFARPQKKKHKCSLAFFFSTVFQLDPSIDDVGWASKPGAAATDDGTLCPRRSSGKTHNHILLRPPPLLSIACRGRAARWIATPLVPKQEQYDEVSNEMKSMMIKVGCKKEFVEENTPVLFIASWMGDNMLKKSDDMPWWSGCQFHLDTLYGVLVKMCKVPSRPLSAPMRMPISGIHKIDVNSVKYDSSLIPAQSQYDVV